MGGTESTCKEQAAAKESAWNRKLKGKFFEGLIKSRSKNHRLEKS